MKKPKAADRAPTPVSSAEEAPAATAAVAAPASELPTPDPLADAVAHVAEEEARLAAAEADLRRLEDEALAEAQRVAAAAAAAVEARAIAREGKILLRAPQYVGGAAVDGVEYHVEDDGVFVVDPAHVPALLEHGFTLVDE